MKTVCENDHSHRQDLSRDGEWKPALGKLCNEESRQNDGDKPDGLAVHRFVRNGNTSTEKGDPRGKTEQYGLKVTEPERLKHEHQKGTQSTSRDGRCDIVCQCVS